MASEDIDDEFNRVQENPKPVALQVIDELNSGFDRGGGGPQKEILGVVQRDTRFDADRGDIVVGISVTAYQQSPWGDSANTQRDFDLTLSDLKRVAEFSTPYQAEFAQMAQKIESAHEAFAQEIEKWRAEGMTTRVPTTVMKPLRLKNGPG